jgi:hypothetical protein
MSPSRYKWIGFSEFQNFCENHHFSEARRYENAPTCKRAASTSRRRWRNASLELLFQTRIRSAKVFYEHQDEKDVNDDEHNIKVVVPANTGPGLF